MSGGARRARALRKSPLISPRSPTFRSATSVRSRPRRNSFSFLAACAQSFRGGVKHRTLTCRYTSENLEIPGSRCRAPRNDPWMGGSQAKEKKAKKKKGPLAMASGPSLGRKRPRRAAIARGATAPQQYATALHKVQGFLNCLPCKFRNSGRTATGPRNPIHLFNFNLLSQIYRSTSLI